MLSFVSVGYWWIMFCWKLIWHYNYIRWCFPVPLPDSTILFLPSSSHMHQLLLAHLQRYRCKVWVCICNVWGVHQNIMFCSVRYCLFCCIWSSHSSLRLDHIFSNLHIESLSTFSVQLSLNVLPHCLCDYVQEGYASSPFLTWDEQHL